MTVQIIKVIIFIYQLFIRLLNITFSLHIKQLMSDQKKNSQKNKNRKIGNDDKTLKLPSQEGLLNKKILFIKDAL